MTVEDAGKYRATSPLRRPHVHPYDSRRSDEARLRELRLRRRRLSPGPGALLRLLEQERQTRRRYEVAQDFPLFVPQQAPIAEEPTLVTDLSGLDRMIAEVAEERAYTWPWRRPSTARLLRAAWHPSGPPLRVRVRYIDPALPYESQVRRRYAQRHAWVRTVQELAWGWLFLAVLCLGAAISLAVGYVVVRWIIGLLAAIISWL